MGYDPHGAGKPVLLTTLLFLLGRKRLPEQFFGMLEYMDHQPEII